MNRRHAMAAHLARQGIGAVIPSETNADTNADINAYINSPVRR